MQCHSQKVAKTAYVTVNLTVSLLQVGPDYSARGPTAAPSKEDTFQQQQLTNQRLFGKN